MKNLNLLYNRTTALCVKNVKFLRLNTDVPETSYICSDDQLLSYEWTSKQTDLIAPLDVAVIGLEYLSLNNELCMATEAGDIVVYNLNAKTNESVTFCDGGLKAMAWSHDQEVVAFVTQANLLVVMNSAYDPMNESRLEDEHFGDEQFINVGWGKKETQFHGTEGKTAAKKPTEDVSIGDLNELDQRVSIVWRGDDEYFVVSFVGGWGRMFKVFDKEGKLKYTSEKCNGLEASIAWRPSGSWIAVPQVLPNKYTIALFEKNGLRHREIVLPFKKNDEQVLKLLWSSDSEVLAIYTQKGLASNVYLYTICNYHWYQKQTLNFNGKCESLEWDINYSEGKTLHVIQENGIYSLYRWDHAIIHSNGITAEDQALVGVVDKSNVLLTNFRGAVVPPPMCGITLAHSTPINYIGFLQHPFKAANSNCFFVVDKTNTFSTFECSFDCNAERNTNLLKDVTLLNSYRISSNADNSLIYCHWVWLTNDQVIFCHNEANSTAISLCKLDANEGQLNILDKTIVDGIVGNVSAGSDFTSLVVHLTTGKFITIKIVEQKFQTPERLFDLNCFCEHIECMAVNNTETKVVALKNQQNLYVDDNKMASDVTSFLITAQFILFTTLDQLKFIRLDNLQIINERRIERGGKLIVSVSHDSRTVLQLPRGNLETIQPRVLSLCIIGELLDSGLYRKAFDLLRKQRINLNLLVDHNPKKFLENLAAFIKDIDNSHWLNLFLSDLLNDDVTISMYSSNYQHLKDRSNSQYTFDGKNKIDVICERCCEVFATDETSKHLLPTITAHVKRKNFETALNLIWSVRLSELATVNQLTNNSVKVVSAHEALKYLLYLVNVNELYDVALGMYDFDLVLFVAQKSQKDPKEYLPFLNELKNLEENYRKYRIDNHLKRYEKALEHIIRCGVEKLEECLELIEKHNLYRKALRLFNKSNECYNDIVLLYADHLRAKGVFYEACLMYERGADYKQAILTAKHTLDWRKCLLLAQKCNYSDEETQQLCLSLVPALQENGKHREAAEIVKLYGENSQQLLIKILCDGKLYQNAIFEAKHLPEPLNDLVRTHLIGYATQSIAILRADIDQFAAYTQRLQVIRKRKTEKLLNGDVDGDDIGDCDLFSDTSSMNSSRFTGTSKGSGKSHRSSKNRRKHERKLMSLKEGNPFEDIALVDAIYNLTHKSFGQQQQIRDILQSLIDLELDAQGIQLQHVYDALLTLIRNSLDTIWIPEMVVSGEVKVEEIMDYVKLQKEQHYAMIKPHQRVKPFLATIDWQLEILK